MKNTDPPHHNHKASKLTPEVHKFIEGMGIYFENQGVPRIGGRILALLMISHDPLSAEELGSILKVSRGSVSTNMRILTAGGLAEKVTIPGDRTTYFEFPPSALEQMVVSRVQSALTFKKIVEQGLTALSTEDFVRHRLEAAIKWTDLIVDTFQDVIVDWRAHQLSQAEKKLQNKPSKFTEAPFRVTKDVSQKN
jgi:predicted transcriptional regulator